MTFPIVLTSKGLRTKLTNERFFPSMSHNVSIHFLRRFTFHNLVADWTLIKFYFAAWFFGSQNNWCDLKVNSDLNQLLLRAKLMDFLSELTKRNWLAIRKFRLFIFNFMRGVYFHCFEAR